jgi:hypothetical protein
MGCTILSELPLPHGKTGWPWTEETPQLPDRMAEGSPWPRVSIVTPSFNQGQSIEETIRSVLLQGYPNLEYLVIDGGSTDCSVEIIKKYEPWLTYWVSEKDRGQSHAINKGFARSTGEIMAWLNSDDVYAPRTMETVAISMADELGCLLVGSGIGTTASDQLEGALDTRKPTWDEMIYEGRTFPQPSVFWTRDLWKSAGPLDEALYFVMDYEYWLRLRPNAENLIFLDNILSIARNHPEQKWRRSQRESSLYLFGQERGRVAIKSARARQQIAPFWIANIWVRNFKRALTAKKVNMIMGSEFHRDILRAWLRETFGTKKNAVRINPKLP